MKKIFIILGLILCPVSAFADDVIYHAPFINRVFHCMPASNSYVTEKNVSVETKFHAWKDGFCRMEVTTTKDNKTTQYNCKMTREQLTDFTTAMKKDPYGKTDAKKIFEKYKKDTTICTPAN